MSNQKLNALDVYEWLCENKLLEGADSNQLSPQFFLLVHEENMHNLSPVPYKELPLLPSTKQDWDKKFMDFIVEAKVPARLEDSKGGVYFANKFSEAGLKVFRKALETGTIYEVLVKSVMLYYKSNVKLKKAVGNYFSQGDWRTDYEALLQSAEQGEEAVTNHIKNEIKSTDSERSNYSLG